MRVAILTSGVTRWLAGQPGITEHADNAAAITGGLVAGNVYAVAGSNPKQLAIVY